MTDPGVVRDFLPIIENAFAQPELIEIEANRKPAITMFLLKHVNHDIADEAIKRQIQETIAFIRSKTSE